MTIAKSPLRTVAGLAVGSVALVGAAFLAGTANADQDVPKADTGPAPLVGVPLDNLDPSTVKLAFENFPKTEAGLTYGSDALAESIDQAPDLIGMQTNDGKLAFARKTDLWAAGPSTPEEAVQYELDLRKNGPKPIPLFDLNGKQIGQYTPDMGTVDLNVARP